MKFAVELDLMKETGEVLLWLRQPAFDLGEDERYHADFLVVWRDPDLGSMVEVVDVKGVETRAFKRIKRLWEKYAELPLRIVRNGKTVEVIEPLENERVDTKD